MLQLVILDHTLKTQQDNMSEYLSQGNGQSPQGQNSAATQEAIPLICHICPKNARFSDLSHLLTHISSKSHLHSKFELELAVNDEDAQRALAEFTSWTRQHGIGDLLRARKSAREQKIQQQTRPTATSSRGGVTAVSHRNNRGGRSRRSRGNNVSVFDQHRVLVSGLLDCN
jgi:hypothetical protein